VASGASDEVGIDSVRLRAFAAELDPEDVRAAADQALPRLPIRFDGLQSEVRFARVPALSVAMSMAVESSLQRR